MSVVVVVKKDNKVAIAADTLTSAGSKKFSHKYKSNSQKFFEYNGTYIGSVGSAMSKIMLKHLLDSQEEEFKFDSLENIYSSMLKIHKILKEEYYLLSKPKTDVPVESSRVHLLFANKFGIFEVSGDRHIANLTKFWAIGSGENYALGAMHTVYNSDLSALEIAKIGVDAACEFDKSCALPMDFAEIDIEG